MESLLNNNVQQEDIETSMSLVDKFNPEAVVSNETKRRMEIEKRRRFFMNPENQAEILMQNYLMSHPDMILSGKQKRNLRREFERKARSGKYKKMFEEQVANIPSDETRETFQNLNA